MAANNNPDAVPDLKQQSRDHQESAIRYFESALQFSDEKVPQDDLVAVRYFLSRLYLEVGRTDEAAAIGLQIAEKHPDSPFAPTAAQVTLAVYERLYLAAQAAKPAEGDEGKAGNLTEAREKLQTIAELIVGRWNDSPAAITAANLLISIALRENRFDDADQLLATIPAASRGAASLNLGGALWTRYLQLSAKKRDSSDPDLTTLKDRAAKLLGEGYQALSAKAKVNLSQAADVLYYVQLLLAEGNADQALEVLENPTVGPLAQLGKEDFTKNAIFISETCKAALRVYLSVDPPQEKKAISMMQRLDKITDSSPQAQQQLTSIYVNLGLQLQEEIKALTASGNQSKARSVAAAFASLLERVASRGDSQSWSVRTWLAETSMQLGSSLEGAAATHYLEQAEHAYRELLNAAEKDPQFAPSELAVLAVRKKLGECLLAEGNYAKAIEQFTAILSDKPNILDLQLATAEALQKWGTTESDPKVLEQSILGSHPLADGKNLVWGWLQMARIADSARRKVAGAKDPSSLAKAAKYDDLYFQARYQAARARLTAAKLASGQQRSAQLQTVRQSIETLQQLYPNMDGPSWKRKFAALLKEAQP